MNTSVHDFFKTFLCSKALWARYIESWIIMIPFFLLVKPALMDYDQIAIAVLIAYGVLVIAVTSWLKKKYPDQMARRKKPYDIPNLSRPELFGLVAFTIVVTGMLGWGLMMAVCFAQFNDEIFFPYLIEIFLVAGLGFGLLVALPMLAEGFFPKHKKAINIVAYIVAGGFLLFALRDML